MLATLSGIDALDQQLAGLPSQLQARLEAKARDLAAALAAKVRDALNSSPSGRAASKIVIEA